MEGLSGKCAVVTGGASGLVGQPVRPEITEVIV
jgi:hypothetical protein